MKSIFPMEQRRERMLDAGLELFLRHGFRGTSMEAIAQRAQVAKPTLYKYYPDKEAIFRAGVVRFITEAKLVCRRELSKPGDVVGKISGALSAKHKLFFRLMEGSSFAEELFSETARLAAKDFGDFERWLEEKIHAELTRNDLPRAHVYTKLIIACAFGIAKKAQQAEEIGPAVRLMVSKILA